MCDAGIARTAGNGLAAFFRIYDHTAELENFKHFSVFGAALLPEENRASVFDFDQQCR